MGNQPNTTIVFANGHSLFNKFMESVDPFQQIPFLLQKLPKVIIFVVSHLTTSLDPSSLVATPLWPSVRMKLTLPKLGTWSHWGSRMFRVRQQRAKHLALGCSWCHWKKVLKCRCPKWPRIDHLDICSPSYGQKKSRESN
jgi:hypothetical protein